MQRHFPIPFIYSCAEKSREKEKLQTNKMFLNAWATSRQVVQVSWSRFEPSKRHSLVPRFERHN